MASTLTMCLLVLLLVAACSAQGNGSYDGRAEKICDVNKLPTLTRLDPNLITGKWYYPYKTHFPPFLKNVVNSWYDIQIREITEDNTKLQFVIANRTVVHRNKRCSSDLVLFRINGSHLTSSYSYDPLHDKLIKEFGYVISIDASRGIMAAYNTFVFDGKVAEDYTTLAVLVRDHSQVPDISGVARELKKFCGPSAGSLSFFKKYPYDFSVSCPACSGNCTTGSITGYVSD